MLNENLTCKRLGSVSKLFREQNVGYPFTVTYCMLHSNLKFKDPKPKKSPFNSINKQILQGNFLPRKPFVNLNWVVFCSF